jgi:MAF protein
MTAQAVLILASGSPRRRQLLASLGLPFRVSVPDVDEEIPSDTDAEPEALAEALAVTKALNVAQREATELVLAADTLVVDGETVLGKPRDAAEAAAMLRRLRDREHRVITDLALVNAGSQAVLTEHVCTSVRMRAYGDDEIEAYIARGEPFDKAGAYAIQDEAFRPVASYDGCYCNVVGLPLRAAVRLLRRGGLDITAEHLVELPKECVGCPVDA